MVDNRNSYGFFVDPFDNVCAQVCGTHSWLILRGKILDYTCRLVESFEELEYSLTFLNFPKESSNKVFTGELFVW